MPQNLITSYKIIYSLTNDIFAVSGGCVLKWTAGNITTGSGWSCAGVCIANTVVYIQLGSSGR
jgi:hypothetical protein